MSSKKPEILTRATRGKMFNEFCCLLLAYFMEEGCFAKTDEEERPIKYYDEVEQREKYVMDDNKLDAAFSGLNAWFKAIYGSQKTIEDKIVYESHMISIRKVREIIYKETGVRPFN